MSAVSKSRFFVAGGAGFIGSHLVDRLMADGHEVTVYDNLSSGKLEFISQHLGNGRFRFVQADLLDLYTLCREITGHRVVFHLAANPEAREGIQHTDLDLRVGTIATYNVLEAMRRNKVKDIVFASSGTVYGETPVKPIPEDYGPLLPISLYGASKLACEGLISAFCGTFGMRAWVFRFANVGGGRTTHGVIYDFIHKLNRNPKELEILGDGTQEKPYLLVDDCIDGILFAWQHAQEQVNVFNLGCPSSTNVDAIARMLVEEMGLKGVEFHHTGGDRGWPGDVPQVRYDVTKMTKLGWKARYTSDEAVREAIRRILRELWTEQRVS
jgi:UDP-glucose 4-epimerase